jgi:hypothetical protein
MQYRGCPPYDDSHVRIYFSMIDSLDLLIGRVLIRPKAILQKVVEYFPHRDDQLPFSGTLKAWLPLFESISGSLIGLRNVEGEVDWVGLLQRLRCDR